MWYTPGSAVSVAVRVSFSPGFGASALGSRRVVHQRVAGRLVATRHLEAGEVGEGKGGERDEGVRALAGEVGPTLVERRADEDHLALADDTRRDKRLQVRGADQHPPA